MTPIVSQIKWSFPKFEDLKNLFSCYFRSYTEPAREFLILEAAAAAFEEAVLVQISHKSNLQGCSEGCAFQWSF